MQSECTKMSEKAAYWESVARNHNAQLLAAVELERAHGMDQLQCLKDVMAATVYEERTALLAEFQAQVALLRSSLLSQPSS
jgi:hypothetical protein